MNRSLISARRRTILAAASALAIAPSLVSAQVNGTWVVDVGSAGGNWSNAANWAGGNIAGNGGTALFNTLPTFTTAPVTILQDSPTVDVSGITFDSFITYLVRATTLGTPNTLTLSGPAVIDAIRPSINTQSATVFGHQIQMAITGSSGLTKTGPGTVTLWATNTYTGGTTINGGIVVARQFGDLAFGNAAGSITLNDGTIRVTTAGWTSSRQIDLAGNGTLEAGTSQNITLNGSITGSGALGKIGSNGLLLNGSSSYTGATNLLAGTISLGGNGALAGTSALTIRNTLTLDNAATNLADRINDSAPVTMLGSGIALIGNASAGSSETLGDVTFSRGTTTVTVTPGTGQSAEIAFGNASRDTGGAAFFRGASLGAAPGANIANITFATTPSLVGGGGAAGTTNISILPWGYGATSAAAAASATTNSFVTYDANGVRPLDAATEHVSSIATAAATDNVRISAGQSVASPATINSLTITSGNGVSGAGPLTITSGGLLNLTASTAPVSVPLEFGSAEAMIISPGSITLSGTINGTGGLSKQGAGVATFSANNTYTGTTTIGGGTAAFISNVPSGANSPFGNSTTAIVLAPAGLGTGGTTARLMYQGAGAGSLDRDLLVSGRIALNNSATIPGLGAAAGTSLSMNGDITLDQSALALIAPATATVTVNGDISGSGGPVTDAGSAAGGTIALNGNNSFAGGMEMGAGATWAVGSDSAFGNTGLIKTVQLGASGVPTILAAGGAHTIANPAVSFSLSSTYWILGGNNDLTFTGSINLSGSYTHNIANTGLTTYAGVLHTGGFTKSGAGTLLLSGSNIYTGSTTISAGTLRVSNNSALGSVEALTTVVSGAALELTGGALTSEPVIFAGTGVGGLGAIRNLANTNSLGDAAMSNNATVAVDAGRLNVGNVSTVPVAGFLLTKTGPGTLEARRYRIGGLSVVDAVATTSDGRSTDKTSEVGLGNLLVSPGATLDIGENDWVVGYASPSPLATLSAQIAQGYNGGNWLGTGITSRFAAGAATSDHTTAIGIAEASDIFTTFPATFSGISNIDSTTVLMRYTYSGDANLDGSVDTIDFNQLASSFSSTSGTWFTGDFNYDGTVDTTDFNLLASNFSQVLAGAGGDTAVGALVPEPSGLMLLALAGSCLAARRRRVMA